MSMRRCGRSGGATDCACGGTGRPPLGSARLRWLGPGRAAAQASPPQGHRARLLAQQVAAQAIHVEPARCIALQAVGAIAGPWPVARALHHAGPHRIELDIATDLQQIAVPIDKNCLEAPLEQMPDLGMPTVVRLRVDAVELLHQHREIGAARVQHEVVVIAHQAVGQHLRVAALQGLGDDGQENLPVNIIIKDGLPAITARGHVVDRTREFDAQRAGHSTSIWLCRSLTFKTVSDPSAA